MKHYTGRIEEVLLEAYKNASLRVSLDPIAHPRFGQYLLANRPDQAAEFFPFTFFPAYEPEPDRPEEHMLLSGPVPEDWEPGTQLSFRSPIGGPLALPKSAQRLTLHSILTKPSRLLGLLQEKLPIETTIVLINEHLPMGLPDKIEIRPPEHLKETIEWADYLILDIPTANAEESLFELENLELPSRTNGAVLISGDFPCGTLADCGLCSLRTKGKEMLACKHGPLFPLSDFLS